MAIILEDRALSIYTPHKQALVRGLSVSFLVVSLARGLAMFNCTEAVPSLLVCSTSSVWDDLTKVVTDHPHASGKFVANYESGHRYKQEGAWVGFSPPNRPWKWWSFV